MSRGNFCIGPVSPEQIGPARSSDRPAGVLIQRKAGKALPAVNLSGIVDHRFFCLDESQRSRRKYAAIQRDGTSGVNLTFILPSGPLGSILKNT